MLIIRGYPVQGNSLATPPLLVKGIWGRYYTSQSKGLSSSSLAFSKAAFESSLPRLPPADMQTFSLESQTD